MKIRFAAVGLAIALALPAAALAQAAAPPAFIFVPHVGATVGAGPGASFSGTVGLKAGPKMLITGEFGQLINILPSSVDEQIEVEAAEVAARRQELAAELPADLLALYEKLRGQKGGVGAAALRARRCGGCSLELDRSELADIAKQPSDVVVRCEECSRILVRTHESGL